MRLKIPRAVEHTVIDFETRSEADLKKVGAWEYSVHPTTEILCMAYKVGAGRTQVWSPFIKPKPTEVMVAMLEDPRCEIIAHNAIFEQCILANVLIKYMPWYPPLPPERFKCTAVKAAYAGLPRSLEGSCDALDLEIKKNKDGRRIMLKMCKPRPAWVKNGTGEKYFFDEEEFKKLRRYCFDDVEATYCLDKAIPDIPEIERKYWLIDQRANLTGFHIDRPLVKKITGHIDTKLESALVDLKALTNGEVNTPGQVAVLLKWFQKFDPAIENLQKATIEKLEDRKDLPEKFQKVLNIRKSSSLSSTKKFKAFLERCTEDDPRIRDSLMFFGASTGRWSGSGIQPHNFPRGTVKCINQAIDMIIEDDNLDCLEAIFGDVMPVFSSALRGMIIPGRGKRFICGDFSQIEVRVLWWLADNLLGLKTFEGEGLVYEEMATHIYRKPLAEIAYTERQLGKAAVLGCGFGMGKDKFLVTCQGQKIEITKEMAALAVETYRTTHKPVVKLWARYEKAAIAAITNPTLTYKINKTKWFMDGKTLKCELPSGRSLSYYDAMVGMKETSWGEKKVTPSYMHVNSQTRKWGRTYTYGGKLVENITQAVARDFMAAAMLRLQDHKYYTILTIHDEILSESEDPNLDEFINIMNEIPEWGKGCPIDSDGWVGDRYKK